MSKAINLVILILVAVLIGLSVDKFLGNENVQVKHETVFVEHLDESKPINGDGTKGEFAIAFINANSNVPLFNRIEYEFKWLIQDDKEDHNRNITVDFFDSKGNDSEQIKQITTAFTGSKHYEVIVIIATSRNPDIPNVIRKLYASHYSKVIILNRAINMNSKDVFFVIPDNYQAGKAQAEHVANYLTKNATIYYLHGPDDFTETSQRYTGFVENLKKLRPDIKIQDSKGAEYSPELAESVVDGWIKSETKISCIVCGNDMLTIGALNSLKKNGLAGTIPIVGIDGFPQIIDEIIDGNIVMTCHQNIYYESLIAFNICTSLYDGEKPHYNSKVPFGIVTQDNVIMYKDKEKY